MTRHGLGLLVLTVATTAIVLGLWVAHANGHEATRGVEAPAPSSFASSSFAFASTPRTIGPATFGYDGGVFFAEIDVGPPPEATGLVAEAIAARFCAEATRMICRARDRAGCDPLEPRVDYDGERELESCHELLFDACAQWAEREYGWQPDALGVSEENVRECLDAITVALRTGEALQLDPSCHELSADRARENERCTFENYPCGHDAHCFDGVCDPDEPIGWPCVDDVCGRTLACVVGLCSRPTPLGGACDDDSVCEGRGVWCLDGVCASHFADGAACTADGDCMIGSHCAFGTCRRASSGPCTSDFDCGSGRACLGEPTPRCEAREAPGAACVTMCDCGVGLYCGDQGVCVRNDVDDGGDLALGAPCSLLGGTGGCRAGLVCGLTDDGARCVEPLALGADCETGTCATDAMCVWRVEDGRCAPAICAVAEFFPSYGEE